MIHDLPIVLCAHYPKSKSPYIGPPLPFTIPPPVFHLINTRLLSVPVSFCFSDLFIQFYIPHMSEIIMVLKIL